MKQELPHPHGEKNIQFYSVQNKPGQEDFLTLSRLFKLLDDPTRLQIFWTLCHVEECVTNLAALLNISSPALFHHLKLLKTSGIITSRREGKEVYYTASQTQEALTLHDAAEQLMHIACPQRQQALCAHTCSREQLTGQEQIFREIHTYLLEHLSERITIEELARMFLMNTTTLKDGFKAVYGTSIGAHIKEHRLERAAQMLTESGLSVAEIAKRVGYTSQSKFSAAFSESYRFSPLDYRKKHTK